MRRRLTRHDDTETALANFALTFAKAMLVFCTILFLLVQPKHEEAGARPRVDYLISVRWPGQPRYDVDTWMRLPDGKIIYYQNREADYVYLERDDLGIDCVHGKPGVPGRDGTCEEIVALRGIAAGEYVLNLHLFAVDEKTAPRPVSPITADVKIMRMEPTVRTVWQGHAQLAEVRGEVHVLRFSLNAAGDFLDPHSDDPVQLRVLAEPGRH